MFNPTYAKLKDDGDNQSVNQAIAIIYNNLNQLSQTSGIVQPLKSQLTISSVYAISPLSQGLFTILIPVQYLVASAGGPFVLTFTTNKTNTTNVIIPISPFGDTITSGNLLFDIYVDNLGNVTSKYWEISGYNANGTYVKCSNGTMLMRWCVNNMVGGGVKTAILMPTTMLLGTNAFALDVASVSFSQVPTGSNVNVVNVWLEGNGANLYYLSQSMNNIYWQILCRWRA